MIFRGESPCKAMLPVFAALTVSGALLALTVAVGADTMWLVALGNDIIRRGLLPVGVPFAIAGTSHWVNVPVLGELVFAGLDALGPWGLISAQVVAATLSLSLIALGAARLDARPTPTALTILVVLLGALPALGVVRAQMMSLPLFALLILILRCEHSKPSRRIWWVVPLVAVWGNLHGAVLVGIAVAGCYLLFSRALRSPKTVLAVIGAMVAALWATPGGLRTHEYYFSVMTNAAARQGEGLWAPLTVNSAFDILLILGAALLLVASLRHRLSLWEYVAIAGLLVMTIQAARHGVWLLLFLAPRSAQSMTQTCPEPGRRLLLRPRVTYALTLIPLITVAGLGLTQRTEVVIQNTATTKRIAALIGPGRSTLAPSPLAESLAAAGVTIWAGNPIDAFPTPVQEAYLDFLRNQQLPGAALPPPDTIVLISHGDRDPNEALPGYGFSGRVAEFTIQARSIP